MGKREDDILEYLTKVMAEFTQKNYGVKLDIPVKWNGRFKRTWGRFSVGMMRFNNNYSFRQLEKYGEENVDYKYIPSSEVIELSKELLKAKNRKTVEDIAKHEALHFALYRLRQPYYDGSVVFERELRKHGLPSTFVKRGELGVTSREWVWICSECSKIVKTNTRPTRKDYSKGYTSNCCRKPVKEYGWYEHDGKSKYIRERKRIV